MNKINNKAHQVRSMVNHPWKRESILQDKVKWDKACASMDVIEDSQFAIESYIKLPSFKAETGGYLFLYGILQALFLQQDAVNQLSEALFGNLIDWEKEYPDLYSIRELRNDVAGHPTNRRNNKSFHFIARYSVSKGHVRLMSNYPTLGKHEIKDIYIADLIKQQEFSVCKVLDKVIQLMKKELKGHMGKFKKVKLLNILPRDLDYCFSKVYEGVYNGYPLAEMNFEIINESYCSIKSEIEERYIHLSALPGLNDLIRRMDYIIQRIENWLKEKTLIHNSDAEVFLDSLFDRFKDLKEMLIELDEEINKALK